MLGEKDVSILGRLKDRIGETISGFIKYMTEKIEYIKPKLDQIKNKLLETKKETALPKGRE